MQQGRMTRLIDTSAGHEDAAGPGSFNDMDMLEVGNGMTEEQDRAHFTMHCLMASPLVAGNDVRTMSNTTRDILTKSVILRLARVLPW